MQKRIDRPLRSTSRALKASKLPKDAFRHGNGFMGMVSMRFLHTGPDYEVDMSTSILEIAKIAGVSKTTVSRVINKQSNVNEQTRRRVEEVIERYNYIPNARAQAFSSQKSMSIGLALTSDATDIFTNPYFSDLLRGVFLDELDAAVVSANGLNASDSASL